MIFSFFNVTVVGYIWVSSTLVERFSPEVNSIFMLQERTCLLMILSESESDNPGHPNTIYFQ